MPYACASVSTCTHACVRLRFGGESVPMHTMVGIVSQRGGSHSGASQGPPKSTHGVHMRMFAELNPT